MPHQNAFKERNISPDRRRRCWIVRDYSTPTQTVCGRIEMHNDAFRAIRPDDTVVGEYDTLTAARASLLPGKRALNCF
jgi:hypothetical protein